MLVEKIHTHARRRFLRAAASMAPRSLLVTRGPRGARRVALTFDDGPDQLTGDYLAALDRLGVTATFFLLGQACAARRKDVLDIVSRGHEVAVHGYTHKRFPPMNPEVLRGEIEATAALLPPSPRRPMVRPPGGATTVGSLLASARAGFTTVLWSVDSNDCRTSDADAVVRHVAPSRLGPGDIVLLHEGQRWTLDALPRIVGRIREAGYEITTVGELLG
jgi:peptidoglycan-N-acetylglucosamine deacetylase